jgi:prepilin-type N-terminal cleavage/methylation domain-containing protein
LHPGRRPSIRRPGLHGFTLIELLVVIAIIALLVTILMPSLQRAKNLVLEIMCKHNLGVIGRGCLLYAEDNDEYFPHADGTYSADTRNVYHGSMYPNGSDVDEYGRRFWFPGRQQQNAKWWHCLGLLWRTGERDHDQETRYVEHPRVFYCPLEKPEYVWWYAGGTWFELEYKQDGEGNWGHPYDGGTVFIEISYLYHANTGVTSVAPRIGEMRNQAIVADRFTYGDRDHETGYNAVGADGSVWWKNDPGYDICTGVAASPGCLPTAGWAPGGWEKLSQH